jgi:hypothetical protein
MIVRALIVRVMILRTVIAGAVGAALTRGAVAIYIAWRGVAVLANLVTVLMRSTAGTIAIEVASRTAAATATTSTTPTAGAFTAEPRACFVISACTRHGVGTLRCHWSGSDGHVSTRRQAHFFSTRRACLTLASTLTRPTRAVTIAVARGAHICAARVAIAWLCATDLVLTGLAITHRAVAARSPAIWSATTFVTARPVAITTVTVAVSAAFATSLGACVTTRAVVSV